MSGPYDRPRIRVNWAQVRPKSWRGWLTAVGLIAVAFAALSLIAVIASTLFVIALVVALVSAVAFFIGNALRGGRSKRDVGPYRGN